MFDILKTDRLILRKARFDDLDLIFNNVWSDESLTKNMLWKVTTNYDDAVERMKRTIKFQSENYAYFVCLKESDEPIGFAGIYEKEPGVYEDTGICIATKYQKKGYGKEVVSAFINLIFESLNGNLFYYGCHSTNECSRRLCLSLGFKHFKSFSCIRDYDNYSYILDMYYFDKKMYDELSR